MRNEAASETQAQVSFWATQARYGKTRSKESTEERGPSGTNFPSYYPHMCKNHTAAQSQGVECAWGLAFLVFVF